MNKENYENNMHDPDLINGYKNFSHILTEEEYEYLLGKLMKLLPDPLYTEIETKKVSMMLSDGVHLSSTICIPVGEGPWPVILVRSPYGQNEEYPLLNGKIFAQQGYVYIYNYVRGTGRSEGTLNPFEQETKDGLEVVDWIIEQNWCNGKIATYGDSYLGYVQWAIAGAHHPAVKTMYIKNFGGHGYSNFYSNGIFTGNFTGWTAQMLGEKQCKTYEELQSILEKAYNARPQENMGTILTGSDCQWYRDWVTNPEENSAYWKQGFWGSVTDAVQTINIPVYLESGWYDPFYISVINSWRMLPETTKN